MSVRHAMLALLSEGPKYGLRDGQVTGQTAPAAGRKSLLAPGDPR
jgi:hypothetical protein